ncbi:chromosome transmission fidelity protein 8 isoform X3 [Biomphalaria glabrata]|nr:chromosome transmission fidelity protein 8 isoform X3 [Biomphalaria glabrata]
MVQIIVQIPTEGKECKEWAIVELQGDLETRHPVPLNHNFIGDLHFTHQDAPVLIIGHHILQGKVISLEKPLAVLTKSSEANDRIISAEDTSSLSHAAHGSSY